MNTTTLSPLFRQTAWLKITSANLISRFGDSIDSIAFAWMIYQLTGSALLMGGILAVNALPNILFAPFSGVLADRFRKQAIIVIGHVGRGTLVSLCAVLYLGGWLEPWQLFILTFLNSTLETFSNPAQGALTVHLVESEQLVQASGLASSAATAVQMIGLGVAGVLIATVGIGGVILIDGATFFLAAGLSALARIKGDQPAKGQLTVRQWWTDLRFGLAFTFNQRTLLVVMFLAMFVNLAFAPLNVLETIYVKDVLRAGPEALSWIGLGLMLGMVAGGLLVGGIHKQFGTWPTIFAGFAGVGLGYALIGLPGLVALPVPAVAAAILFYFLTGLALPLINSPLGAWLSGNVPPELQGRVFATLNAFCLMATPLGSAAAGAIAAAVPLPLLFVGLGLLVALVTIPARLALPDDAADRAQANPALDEGPAS